MSCKCGISNFKCGSLSPEERKVLLKFGSRTSEIGKDIHRRVEEIRTLHLIRRKSYSLAGTKSLLAAGGALVAAAAAVWKEEDHRDSEVRPWMACPPKHDPEIKMRGKRPGALLRNRKEEALARQRELTSGG